MIGFVKKTITTVCELYSSLSSSLLEVVTTGDQMKRMTTHFSGFEYFSSHSNHTHFLNIKHSTF